MAVVRTATVTGHRTTGSSTTLGDTATCNTSTTGADHFAVVAAAISVSTNSSGTTCGLVYGGNAMTPVGALQLVGSSTNRNAIGFWTLQNPPTGSQNIVATSGGASTKAAIAQGGGVYSGVGSVSSLVTAASLTVAVPSTVGGKVVAATTNANALSAPTQTQLYLDGSAVGGSGDYILVQDANGTGSNVSFSSTGTAGQANSIGIALNVPTPKFNTFTESFTGSYSGLTVEATTPGNIAVVGDQLRIDHGTGVEYNEIRTTADHDLTSSSISVELVDAGNQGISTHEAWFYLEQGGVNRVLFVVKGGNLYFQQNNSDLTTAITYSPTTHRYLRFREAAGTIYFDTADTSGVWTNRFSYANPFALTSLPAYWNSCQQSAGSASYAIFDNVNIVPGVAVPAESYSYSRVAVHRANLW